MALALPFVMLGIEGVECFINKLEIRGWILKHETGSDQLLGMSTSFSLADLNNMCSHFRF